MTTDAQEMGMGIDGYRHDLGVIARCVEREHMTVENAFGAINMMTTEFLVNITKILERVRSQPILPGMEKEVVAVTQLYSVDHMYSTPCLNGKLHNGECRWFPDVSSSAS